MYVYNIRINVSTIALSTYPESDYTIRVHQYKLIERLTVHFLCAT